MITRRSFVLALAGSLLAPIGAEILTGFTACPAARSFVVTLDSGRRLEFSPTRVTQRRIQQLLTQLGHPLDLVRLRSLLPSEHA